MSGSQSMRHKLTSSGREFLVITVGVLAALYAEARYTSRGEADLAEEYRTRIAEELELNSGFIAAELLMTRRQIGIGDTIKDFFELGKESCRFPTL